MKVNLDAPLADPKGQPFTDKATLATAAYAAVSSPLPTDMQAPMEKRLQTYRLLQKIAMGGEQEISTEELAEIKERISKTMPVIVLGAVVDVLESAKIATLPQPVPSTEAKAG